MAILPIDGGRYGTPEMRLVFGDQRKIDYQVQIEGAVALAQGELGIIPKNAANEITGVATPGEVSVKRVAELEAQSDHDTAALVEALAERCRPNARPWIHYGLTSNDLVDTSNSMQMRDAVRIILPKIVQLASALAEKAQKYANLPAVGRTHGQHASVMSFGLKFANWAEEMLQHVQRIRQMARRVLLCKTLGVVGTGSLMGNVALRVQEIVAKRLDLYPIRVATQVVPRERYSEYVYTLALIGSTLDKIGVEIRNLQRTEIGEVSEQFRPGQMGSSAVPVKRNPIKSERVSSLAKLLRGQVGVSFENIPLWHERDLSNSANERFIIPTVSIIADDMIQTMFYVVSNMAIHTEKVRSNLAITSGQLYAEFVLDALIQTGIPRMIAYRDVQRVAFAARENNIDFRVAVTADQEISSKLDKKSIEYSFRPENHLGASAAMIARVAESVRAEARTL